MDKFPKNTIYLSVAVALALGLSITAIVKTMSLQRIAENFSKVVATPEKVPLKTKETGLSGNADTSNWKTYRNETYGFEVRYPVVWHIIGSNTSRINLSDRSKEDLIETGFYPYFEISVHREKTVQELYGEKFNNECKLKNVIGFDEYECKPIDSPLGEKYILINKNNIIYQFIDAFNNEVSAQILSTFKFIR